MTVKINIEVMCQAVIRLTKLLLDEVHLLKSNDIKNIEPLLPIQSDLVQFLQNQQLIIKQNPKALEGTSEEQKKLLKLLFQELQDAAEINFQEASKAKYANEKIIEILAEAMKKRSGKYSRYNKHGEKKISKVKIDETAIQINEAI